MTAVQEPAAGSAATGGEIGRERRRTAVRLALVEARLLLRHAARLVHPVARPRLLAHERAADSG